MPVTVLNPDDVASIARRHGFVSDSGHVAACLEHSEYLHGFGVGAIDLGPLPDWGIDPTTGRYSAALLLDGYLRRVNAHSATTGEAASATARLH